MSLIFIAIGRGLGFFIGNYFMSRVGFGIVHDLRAELFQKLHDLPKSYFDANQSGQFINRITFTTTQVSLAASNAVKTFVREGFLLVGLFAYLMFLNYKLTLLLIVTAPFGSKLESPVRLLPSIAGKAPVSLVASIVVEVNAPAELILAFSTPLAWNFISLEEPSAFSVRCSSLDFIVDICYSYGVDASSLALRFL